MSIRKFIGASSALLLAWLGATYLHHVPAERYPKQGRAGETETVETSNPADSIVASADLTGQSNR